MPLEIAARSKLVSQSDIRSMTIECARLNGINLAQGVCDLDVPPVVIAGAKEGMDKGYNIYTRYDGLAEFRRAAAQKQKRFTGLDYDPESEIIASAGTTGILHCVCMALFNPGDEIILFEPGYGYHDNSILAAGLKPVRVALQGPDWPLDHRALEAKVTRKTRGIVINTPGNPSGKVFSRQELELVADFAQAHDLFVITDEIYEHFVYDGLEHLSPAAIKGMRERTILVSGVSKCFSVTGWRIGYCFCDAAFSQAIGHFNDLYYVCAPAPLQMGAARGLLELGPEYYQGIADDHQMKRDMFCRALDQAGLTPLVPKGSYYILADLGRIPGADSKERADELLRRTGVACVPGRAFFSGGQGDKLGRFCFARETPILREACQRLERLD